MRTHTHTHTHTLSLSPFRFKDNRIQLTAIRGFMSASAMPLCSVTPCKVDQGPLYPARSRGILEAPTKKKKKRRGPLASESNSAVRRFSPPLPPVPPVPLPCPFNCVRFSVSPVHVTPSASSFLVDPLPSGQPNSDDRRSLRNRFVRPSLVSARPTVVPSCVLDLDSWYTHSRRRLSLADFTNRSFETWRFGRFSSSALSLWRNKQRPRWNSTRRCSTIFALRFVISFFSSSLFGETERIKMFLFLWN